MREMDCNMQRNIEVNRLNLTDIDMYQCGEERCKPGHDYGPAVRDHFLIHYILEGEGKFYVGEKVYKLRKNQGFLICPDIVTYYQADYENPWHYIWVGFNGLKAESYLRRASITADNPVFTYDCDDYIKNCLKEMIKAENVKKGREIKLTGLLYLFLSRLIEINGNDRIACDDEDSKELYVKKSVEYIQRNYSRKLTVSSMAKYIGIDRSYLGSLFKQYLGISPQQYIMKFRIDKACELMRNPALSIGDISRSVGYEDQLLFSKTFKKIKGISPKAFRSKYKTTG